MKTGFAAKVRTLIARWYGEMFFLFCGGVVSSIFFVGLWEGVWFISYQIMAAIVVVITSFLWALKKGAQDEMFPVYAGLMFIAASVIYMPAITLTLLANLAGLLAVKNSWFIYISAALFSGFLSGFIVNFGAEDNERI